MGKDMWKFVYQIICALGAVSCILVWLGIKPSDIWGWRMSLVLPHWMWLAAAVVLFGLCLWSSLYSLYRSKADAQKTEGTSTPPPISSSTPSLPDRVGGLAQELLQFLWGQGPAPKVGGDTSDARWQSMRDALTVNRERLPRIHDGYMARFHDRAEKIIYELGAIGIRDWDLNNLLNKDAYSDTDVEAIANKLLALGGQLMVQDYTDHFKVEQPKTSEIVPLTAPRPYLEVEDPIDERHGKTLFHFTNRGGDVAHNIQVQPFVINHLSVGFESIPLLAVGETKTVVPLIPGIGISGGHDILNQMEKEWESAWEQRKLAQQERIEEWKTEITVTYEDFNARRFEATLELVIFPVLRTLRNKHALELPQRNYKTVEVRKIKFKEVG
ncbi:MAG: hypothetical protein ACJ71W_16795 [Terriglobales bacterium]